MKIQYESMNRFNRKGVHLSVAAWRNSKDMTTDPTFNDVFSMDLPFNEFPSAVVKIKSTIIEREIIATLRDHLMWARSSRVDDITQFTIPEPYYSSRRNYFEQVRDNMIRMKGTGARQDQYRLLTPILAETEYTIRINLRMAAKLHLYFINLIQTTRIPELFEDAANAMHEVIVKLSCDNADVIIENTRFFDINPTFVSEFIPEKEYTGKIGDVFSITMRVPFSMRTHLVRHRGLLIKDNLRKIIESRGIYTYNLHKHVKIQVTGDVDFWKQIMSSRSCWIADYTLWKPVLDKLAVLNLGKEILPCSLNKERCPYSGDVEQRFQEKDPNSPCPLFAVLNKRALTNDQLDAINKQYVEEERLDFWSEIIGEFKHGRIQ